MPALPAIAHPGDDVIPDAVMVYSQGRVIDAPPSDVWPWVMQVGKGRGGWYTPASFEAFMPKSWHATRTINPAWQNLQPEDRVDDYGFSADDYFIVSEVQPEEFLVYKSDRYGASFSWALILHEMTEGGRVKTLLHLRFRGKIAVTGLKKRLLVTGGGIMDHITTAPMLAGLKERAEHSKAR
ncbi:uncharacterized protein LTR77_005605 [Saxophila tyrrhenica]|uniref:Uncharacterized protein n=1 Tax=Saxophila tyrrhenica TaxID=1690608 RepID=A0AAV9P930_9PEZI|nr:hypothetical protein LTR77_005605 [Saxophila tyrrhenica]